MARRRTPPFRLARTWENADGSVGYSRVLSTRDRVVVWACPPRADDLTQCEQVIVAVTRPPPRGRRGFCYKGRLTSKVRSLGVPAGTKINFCEDTIYALVKKKR